MNDTKFNRAIARVEQASAALVEQAHVLTTADNRICWKIRENTAQLLARAREYAAAMRAIARLP